MNPNPIPTQIYTIPTPNPIPLHMIPNPESNPDSDSDSSFDSNSGFGIAPGLNDCMHTFTVCIRMYACTVKKVGFYIAQYPVRSLFLSWQTCSFRHQLGFSWKHSSHAAIAQRLFTHMSTTVYSQVLIYTAESTEAS